MRVAIMQPYFFPYIGYFELIKSVDLFILLTTVQYIRRGWVNRNRIRGPQGWLYLTVPVRRQPRSTLIQDTQIDDSKPWKARLLSTLSHTYKRAAEHPLYQCLEMHHGGLLCPLLCRTLKSTCAHLNIQTEIRESWPVEATKEDLIISICKSLGASTYVNLPGGKSLYNEADFANHGIQLEFMPATSHKNTLSILDLCLGDGLTSCVLDSNQRQAS